MDDIGRNRAALAVTAAFLIVIGLLVTGALPRADQATSETKRDAVALNEYQGEDFLVRDYSEFGNSVSDLPSSDWLGLLTSMIVKLGIVIGLFYLAIKLWRGYIYRGKLSATPSAPIALIGTLNLMPNRAVYLIDVGGKMLVVGATQNQLTLLAEITDSEALAQLRTKENATPSPAFPSLLDAAKRRFGLGRNDTDVIMTDVIMKERDWSSALDLRMNEAAAFLRTRLDQFREASGGN